MPRNQFRYNVFDITKCEFVLKNVEPIIVADTIGINKAKIATYARENYMYDKRYHITRNPIKTDVVDIEDENDAVTMMPHGFKEEWDKARLSVNPNARTEDENGLDET